MENIRTYDFNNVMEIAKFASYNITNFLKRFPESIAVVNVEDDKRFQDKDIDLLWIIESDNEIKVLTIEVKGDRYKTGNFFFETKSNVERNTDGCFLITESDYLLYYFINENKVYILPTKEVRKWFLENKERFKIKYTTTNVGINDYYTTEGYLVPRWFLEKKLKIKPIIIKEVT